MKAAKIIGILLLVYVAIVVIFVSSLGYFQPQSDQTLVLTTRDAQGTSYNRVLARIAIGDQVYVSVNNWPRAWYNRILENPAVEVTFKGETTSAIAAVVTSDEENTKVNQAIRMGPVIRVLTGFPPRYFVRLDPE